MKTWCERQGQVEIGVIEHEGRTYAALGSSVQGRQITAYTANKRGISLTSWCGKTVLSCRSETVQKYRDGSIVLLFRLGNDRFIIGYALGDKGMLFRGELVTNCNQDDAHHSARQIANHFAELDAENEAEFEREQNRTLRAEYHCPECFYEWKEVLSTVCDSVCPQCGLSDITAFSWEEADE